MWSKKVLLYLVRRVRPLSQRFPLLTRFGRYLGLRKQLSAGDMGRLVLDQDVIVELDLSVRAFRHLYYIEDLQRSPELRLVSRLGDPEGYFVDVGANVGYFSLVAAKYYAGVISIEPSRFNLNYLEGNLKLNPGLAANIRVLPVAVGKETRDATLFRPVDQPLAACLSPVPGFHTEQETVWCTTLDALLESPTNVTTIKIDTEGAEYDILQGGQRILKQNRPWVICEISDRMQKRFGNSALQILKLFKSIKYQCVIPPYEINSVLENETDFIRLATQKAPLNALFAPIERIKQLKQ